MIDRWAEERVRIELRAKVTGVDARCDRFCEHALATNISRSGALLSQMTTELRCGDLLAIEYGSRRAHYRIVWVPDTGSEGTRVAVHRLLPVAEAVGD